MEPGESLPLSPTASGTWPGRQLRGEWWAEGHIVVRLGAFGMGLYSLRGCCVHKLGTRTRTCDVVHQMGKNTRFEGSSEHLQ